MNVYVYVQWSEGKIVELDQLGPYDGHTVAHIVNDVSTLAHVRIVDVHQH